MICRSYIFFLLRIADRAHLGFKIKTRKVDEIFLIYHLSYGFQYQNVFIDPRAEIQICTGGGIGEGAGVV